MVSGEDAIKATGSDKHARAYLLTFNNEYRCVFFNLTTCIRIVLCWIEPLREGNGALDNQTLWKDVLRLWLVMFYRLFHHIICTYLENRMFTNGLLSNLT